MVKALSSVYIFNNVAKVLLCDYILMLLFRWRMVVGKNINPL